MAGRFGLLVRSAYRVKLPSVASPKSRDPWPSWLGLVVGVSGADALSHMSIERILPYKRLLAEKTWMAVSMFSFHVCCPLPCMQKDELPRYLRQGTSSGFCMQPIH